MPQSEPLLYHYCPLDSLRAIVQSREIWLSSLGAMNDYHELHHAAKVLGPAALKAVQEFEGAINAPEDWKYQTRQAIKKADDPAFMELNRLHSFAICFSREPDLLNQWRSYAANGAGVAIGFSSMTLAYDFLDINEAIQPPPKTGPFFYEVRYSDESQQEVITAICDDLRDCYHNTHEGDTGFWSYLSSLHQLSPAIKPESFSEEREVRLVYHRGYLEGLYDHEDQDHPFAFDEQMDRFCRLYGPTVPDESYLNPTGTPRVDFRTSNSQLIPIARIPFPLKAITEVVLGPKQTNRFARDTVRMLLASAGCDLPQVKISSSDITYR